jgi:hypothetical protein
MSGVPFMTVALSFAAVARSKDVSAVAVTPSFQR